MRLPRGRLAGDAGRGIDQAEGKAPGVPRALTDTGVQPAPLGFERHVHGPSLAEPGRKGSTGFWRGGMSANLGLRALLSSPPISGLPEMGSCLRKSGTPDLRWGEVEVGV